MCRWTKICAVRVGKYCRRRKYLQNDNMYRQKAPCQQIFFLGGGVLSGFIWHCVEVRGSWSTIKKMRVLNKVVILSESCNPLIPNKRKVMLKGRQRQSFLSIADLKVITQLALNPSMKLRRKIFKFWPFTSWYIVSGVSYLAIMAF